MEKSPAVEIIVDPETEFLALGTETGTEWELFKENVRPLKRGRKVEMLNNALKANSQPAIMKSLLETRRRMIEAIDEYKGEDPLEPWTKCIKWVQESFPGGGECSGLVLIYEQCVRAFWHDERYKNDLRYLKIWLEYADNCADSEVIYQFLEANNIGQNHSLYYMSYASHMESKNKLKKADEIFNLGIARKARPLEKLEAAYKKFIARSTMKKTTSEEEYNDHNVHMPARSFGTVLAATETRRPLAGNIDTAVRRKKLQDISNAKPLSVYNDTHYGGSDQPDNLKNKERDRSWQTLGRQSDRNKENTSMPTKWTSFKVPLKGGSRTTLPSAPIPVFVDEEPAGIPTVPTSKNKTSSLQLRQGDSNIIKKEIELLKENPLRNFPASSLR